MTDASATDTASITQLAAEHGLDIDEHSIEINELGLDFRVAFVRTIDAEHWVLRMPRRPDAMERAEIEARVLRVLSPRLDVAIPDWQIHSDELIAYPVLPGTPGLEIDDDGEPIWKVDPSNTEYCTTLAELLVALHSIDPSEFEGLGVPVYTPEEERARRKSDIDRVTHEFEVAEALRERWQHWLEDDSYWPDHSVFTHGEIYPAHTLTEGSRISGVLDWTTAAVGDPAKDFVFHQSTATPEAFERTLEQYTDAGGTVWPRLAEHCAEILSASAVEYGVFALETGDEQHRQAAAMQLNPQT